MSNGSASTRVESSGPPREHATSRRTADFLYGAFYGGAVGGSVLALFVLVVDIVSGQALFTPSLLGTVLLTEAPASPTAPVRLDMVAYFSIFHFIAFLIFGAVLSAVHQRLRGARARALLTGVVAFVGLTAGFLLWAALLMPGVVDLIGIPWILLGNLLAAVSMVVLLEWAHRQSEAPRVV